MPRILIVSLACAGPGPIDFGPTDDSVIVVGAGIAGLATAAALHKVHFTTHVSVPQ
jgi:monoamine oxidase